VQKLWRLGEEGMEVFQVRGEGVGCGVVTGETRDELVETREMTRAKLLNKALEEFRPQKARSVWSWRQRYKLSTVWMLALPLPHTGLSNEEFSEATAASLCLPSPACQDRVGEIINGRGRKGIDKYGDHIQSTCLKVDHWRQRQDQIKLAIYRLCM
jgi:hypothetical protein